MRQRRIVRGMAGPLVAALGVHVALAGLVLSVRPRALPEVVEVRGVLLVPVMPDTAMAARSMADVPVVEELAVDGPVAAGPSVGADLQEAEAPQAVVWPSVLPAVAAPRPGGARLGGARVSAPMAARSEAAPVAVATTAQAGPDAAAVSAWQAALSGWVEQNRRYPPLARFRQEEGVVQVRFELDAVGRVLRVEMQRESGSAALDTAAVALFTGATLPAPPRELAPGLRVVTLPIRYRLQ